VLFLTGELNRNVILSARNIPNVDVMRFADASTYDILRADTVVVEELVLGALESGGEVQLPVSPPKPKKAPKPSRAEAAAQVRPAAKAPRPRAAAKKVPAAKKAARPAAKKAAKPKAAAKKPAAKKPAAKKKKKD
jgi:hypothetical protein